MRKTVQSCNCLEPRQMSMHLQIEFRTGRVDGFDVQEYCMLGDGKSEFCDNSIMLAVRNLVLGDLVLV